MSGGTGGSPTDPTCRFSDRVADYARYRPSYPAAALDELFADGAGEKRPDVADVGSGTGIFTALLLPRAATVHAVEPNAAMRAEASRRLGPQGGYVAVDGTAERTTLPDRSVDLVTAAQAFHWFDPVAAEAEFARILRPDGRVALIWNRRDHAGSAFLERYERLLATSLPDYVRVTHERASADVVSAFLGPGARQTTFPHHQRFDFDGLRGRLLSSSYAPQPGQDGHEALMDSLRALFDEFAVDGEVRFDYRTELHVSAPRAS